MGQSKGEENMDRWNNQQGRQIAQKIMKEIKNPFVLKTYVLSGKLEDRIAEEVMQKMNKERKERVFGKSKSIHQVQALDIGLQLMGHMFS